MSLDNYIFTALVFLIAIFVANQISSRIYHSIERDRDTQLDGLRGLLALAVYICHVAAWYNYFKTGSYMQSGPGLYYQLAKIGVFMFFMITGYLFIGKVLRERKGGIDWTRFIVSRVLRIAPLYLFAVSVMLLIISKESAFQLQQPIELLIPDVFEWVTFTIFGSPLINDYEQTALILSHVQWTLVYEWIFYLSLPLVALAMRIRVPILFLIIIFSLLVSIYFNRESLFLPTGFIGGGLTALICIHFAKIKTVLVKPVFSFAVIGLLILQGVLFPEFGFRQPAKYSAALICAPFLIIAAGNDLFGLLTNKAVNYLGKISYSIYLMHGIILFICFKFVLGFDYASTLSRGAFGALILGVTICVVLISSMTYYLIEEPAMMQVKNLTNWFKCMFKRKKWLNV
jgi:peptidoglycan/LPS O-acetylase OafA/YrhL